MTLTSYMLALQAPVPIPPLQRMTAADVQLGCVELGGAGSDATRRERRVAGSHLSAAAFNAAAAVAAASYEPHRRLAFLFRHGRAAAACSLVLDTETATAASASSSSAATAASAADAPVVELCRLSVTYGATRELQHHLAEAMRRAGKRDAHIGDAGENGYVVDIARSLVLKATDKIIFPRPCQY
jgi:hypothetical protein